MLLVVTIKKIKDILLHRTQTAVPMIYLRSTADLFWSPFLLFQVLAQKRELFIVINHQL